MFLMIKPSSVLINITLKTIRQVLQHKLYFQTNKQTKKYLFNIRHLIIIENAYPKHQITQTIILS